MLDQDELHLSTIKNIDLEAFTKGWVSDVVEGSILIVGSKMLSQIPQDNELKSIKNQSCGTVSLFNFEKFILYFSEYSLPDEVC